MYDINVKVNLIKENVIQVNGGIMINVDVNVKNSINVKSYIWNPSTSVFENWKYLASIMDDSAIMLWNYRVIPWPNKF